MYLSHLVDFLRELKRDHTTDFLARALKEAFTQEEVALLIERLSV